MGQEQYEEMHQEANSPIQKSLGAIHHLVMNNHTQWHIDVYTQDTIILTHTIDMGMNQDWWGKCMGRFMEKLNLASWLQVHKKSAYVKSYKWLKGDI